VTGGPAADAVALAWRAAPSKAFAQTAVALLAGVAPVATGVLTKLLMDRVTGQATGGLTTLAGLAVGLAVVGVLIATLPHLSRYIEAEWDRAVTVAAQMRLYAAVNRLVGLVRLEDPAFRDRLRLAEEAGRTSPTAVVGGALEVLRAAVAVVGFVCALATRSPWMVAVVIAAAIPTARAELRLSRQRAELLGQMSPAARRQFFYSDLLTGLDAAKEIRLFGLADLFGARMLRELRMINAETRRLDRVELRTQVALGFVGAVAAGAGLVWAAHAAMVGRLTVGDLAIFIAAVAGVQGAVASGISRFADMHRAILLYRHFCDVVNAGPDLAEPPRPAPTAPLRRGIELHDVWFRYCATHPWVLRGVDLTIPSGATVALVGLNGAGKSTLVKLLLRFYDPTRGSVRWDGRDLRELSAVQLRGRIGVAFQDFMAYDLPAAENIGLGDLSALDDSERVSRAAEQAGVHDTLVALPRGYATPLTRMFTDMADRDNADTGVLLSGGQWQRVALARSFLRADRDLLILDEPSAGLDPEAEYDIHHRLRSLRQGRTTLLISHRLSAVRDADRIVVIADGRVVEQGSHTELMATGGAYARMFGLQAQGYQEDP
jgi:ATP-binding cassette subfamily B protein